MTHWRGSIAGVALGVGLSVGGTAVAAERSIDRAWGNVLAGMKKRFDSGPQDWSEWLKQLRQMQEKAGQK